MWNAQQPLSQRIVHLENVRKENERLEIIKRLEGQRKAKEKQEKEKQHIRTQQLKFQELLKHQRDMGVELRRLEQIKVDKLKSQEDIKKALLYMERLQGQQDRQERFDIFLSRTLRYDPPKRYANSLGMGESLTHTYPFYPTIRNPSLIKELLIVKKKIDTEVDQFLPPEIDKKSFTTHIYR